MKREHLLVALFFLIAGAFVYLFYRIIIPFFSPICWAAVLVILFFPLYEKVRGKVKSKGLASLLLCVFIIILIVGPITYLFAALVNEAADVAAQVNDLYRDGKLDKYLAIDLPWWGAVKKKLSQYYDLSQINIDQLIRDSFNKAAGIIFDQTGSLITNATKAIFNFILMIFTMYYFFKDGTTIVRQAKRLMPIPAEQVELTFGELREVIQATMYGGIVVALIQGLLGGILFAIVGIPSAVLWGAVMAFLSILPLLGAFLVYVPAGIVLVVGGSYIKGIIIIVVGTVVISQIDNVLRPWFISGRTAMHPLLLFFAILGGIALLGLLGVVVGPLVAAVFVTLLKILEIKLHPEPEAEPTQEPASE